MTGFTMPFHVLGLGQRGGQLSERAKKLQNEFNLMHKNMIEGSSIPATPENVKKYNDLMEEMHVEIDKSGKGLATTPTTRKPQRGGFLPLVAMSGPALLAKAAMLPVAAYVAPKVAAVGVAATKAAYLYAFHMALKAFTTSLSAAMSLPEKGKIRFLKSYARWFFSQEQLLEEPFQHMIAQQAVKYLGVREKAALDAIKP